MKNATRIFTSTFGSIMALAGLEHGVGELLQGNITPAGVMIQSWPNAEFFRNLGGEPAMTIIPSLLVSGILTILTSLALLIWAVFFVQRKNGGLVMILISMIMLLVGAGFFPPILTMLIGVVATRINSSQSWWRRHVSADSRRILAKLWGLPFTVCAVSWFALIPGVGIVEQSFGVDTTLLTLILICTAFGSLLLTVITGFARDSLLPPQMV